MISALARLLIGLVLYGVSVSLILRASLGVTSWDVLHQGVARVTGIPIGTIMIATSFVVLVLWIPLRQRLGIGTVANAVLVGLTVDAVLPLLVEPDALWSRAVMLAYGILLNGLATGLYIGAGLGPGPRDGLMTGLAARTGRSIRLVRTSIEVAVLLIGWTLGGQVGIGTLLYAVSIGPLAQFFLPMLSPARPPTVATGIRYRYP